MNTTRIWRHFDIWLLAAVALLTISGVAMIQSAIGGNEDLAQTVPRQAIYALIGLVVLILTAAIDYRIWSALSRALYMVVLGFLGLILAAGVVGFGSARWFNIGIVNVQPSELSKILMILVLARRLPSQTQVGYRSTKDSHPQFGIDRRTSDASIPPARSEYRNCLGSNLDCTGLGSRGEAETPACPGRYWRDGAVARLAFLAELSESARDHIPISRS